MIALAKIHGTGMAQENSNIDFHPQNNHTWIRITKETGLSNLRYLVVSLTELSDGDEVCCDAPWSHPLDNPLTFWWEV